MAGMIKNIFGLNTQDVAEQRAELNRLKSAQRIKQGDIDPTVAILGQQFGDMLGRGLMKKLGYEDKEFNQAQSGEEDTAELNRKVADGELEFGSKEYNLTLAGLYTKYGEPEKAAQYFSKVQNEERYEFERNGRIGNVARAIVNDSDGTITQEKFMSQLKAAYPNQDLSRYDNFITDDDVFGEGTVSIDIPSGGTAPSEESSFIDNILSKFNAPTNNNNTPDKRSRKQVRDDSLVDIRRQLGLVGESSNEEFLSGKRRGGQKRNPNYDPRY